MQELDRRVGMLRLLLADLSARRQQTEDLRTQLRQQVDRLVEFTVRRNAVVANALSAMADLDERQRRAEADLRHIELLRHRAQQELDALLVTRGIGEARARLEELERESETVRSAEAPDTSRLSEIAAEMAELRTAIERASEQAARALTEGQGL
jgi:Rps23 Pro-64 3,4-dihydroxylase Tpa1-like proline 4-hydroxylase